MLTIFGRASAYNVQKVHWFLEELGIEYQHINVGGAAGGLDTAAFLNMNPNARIPIIKDGEHVVWESNSILRYLAAVYGPDQYWNNCPAKRSQFERWMDWELASLQPTFIDLFWGYYRTPLETRNEQKIADDAKRFAQYLHLLDAHLQKNTYLSGENFGLADICVGTCFYRYLNMGLKVTIPKSVSEWYVRLQVRAGYKKVIQVSFSDLKGRLTF